MRRSAASSLDSRASTILFPADVLLTCLVKKPELFYYAEHLNLTFTIYIKSLNTRKLVFYSFVFRWSSVEVPRCVVTKLRGFIAPPPRDITSGFMAKRPTENVPTDLPISAEQQLCRNLYKPMELRSSLLSKRGATCSNSSNVDKHCTNITGHVDQALSLPESSLDCDRPLIF